MMLKVIQIIISILFCSVLIIGYFFVCFTLFGFFDMHYDNKLDLLSFYFLYFFIELLVVFLEGNWRRPFPKGLDFTSKIKKYFIIYLKGIVREYTILLPLTFIFKSIEISALNLLGFSLTINILNILLRWRLDESPFMQQEI